MRTGFAKDRCFQFEVKELRRAEERPQFASWKQGVNLGLKFEVVVGPKISTDDGT